MSKSRELQIRTFDGTDGETGFILFDGTDTWLDYPLATLYPEQIRQLWAEYLEVFGKPTSVVDEADLKIHMSEDGVAQVGISGRLVEQAKKNARDDMFDDVLIEIGRKFGRARAMEFSEAWNEKNRG